MAIRLSKAQHEAVALALRAALTSTPVVLTGRQRRSLFIAYDKIQEDGARVRQRGSRSNMLTAREAEEMLEDAAVRQSAWINKVNP